MELTEQLQRAESLLLNDEAQNVYPLLRLRQGAVGACWFLGDSVCLWDAEHNKYCYAVTGEEALVELFRTVRPRGGALVSLVTEGEYAAALRPEADIEIMRCVQLLAAPYQGDAPVVEGVHYTAVPPTLADWIMEVYPHPELSPEFIAKRAARPFSVAAWHGDTPVGFFITHSDAELGPAYVDPAYRGTGLAEALYAQMLHRVPQGGPTVINVVPDNHASLGWLARMGCTPTPRQTAWFWMG